MRYPKDRTSNPNEINRNLKFDRWSACMDDKQNKLFVLFSNYKFAWIYRFKFNDDDSLTQEGEPSVVS